MRGSRWGGALVFALALGSVTYALAGSVVTIESNPAGSGNGLTYREADASVPVGGGTHVIAAECPDGKVVTGGGALVGGLSSEAAIAHLGPNRYPDVAAPPRSAWSTIPDNFAGSAKLVVTTAICAAPRGLSLRTRRRTPTSPNSTVTLKANCTRDESVTGGGVSSESNLNDRILASAPFDDGDRGAQPDDGWRARIRVSIEDRDVFASAICREGRSARSKIVYRSHPETGSGEVNSSVNCPVDAVVMGGGFALSGGGAYLNSSYPAEEGPGSDAFDAWGVYTFSNSVRTTTAHAICKRA